MYEKTCIINEWIDGDTVDITVDLTCSVYWKTRMRLFGLNCPEVHSLDQDEKKKGLEAKEFAQKLIPVGTKVKIVTVKENSTDKYGRFLADITLSDGTKFSNKMIEAGHGVFYDGGKR